MTSIGGYIIYCKESDIGHAKAAVASVREETTMAQSSGFDKTQSMHDVIPRPGAWLSEGKHAVCLLVLLGAATAGLAGPASWSGKAATGESETLIAVALAPMGDAAETFFFGLYWSERLARQEEVLEPGFPAGWATTLSLRLVEGTDGAYELRDPTGLVRRFERQPTPRTWSAAGGFVLLQSPPARGAHLTDPVGCEWQFDEQGYVRGLVLPDKTRIAVVRDAATRRIDRIEIEPVGSRESAGTSEQFGYQFWKWPLVCRWPRPEQRKLWLAAGRSLPGALPISDAPAASSVAFDWDGDSNCTMLDSTGRWWRLCPGEAGSAELQGTTLHPENDRLATVTIAPDRSRIKHLPAWIFGAPAERFARAERPDGRIDDFDRSRSPLAVPRIHPLAKCPRGWKLCNHSLDLPDTGHSHEDWYSGGNRYKGILYWDKRYRSSFFLVCEPGERKTRTEETTIHIELELAIELGLIDVGSTRVGVTGSRTKKITQPYSVSCCRVYDEELQKWIQTCRKRYFQPVYEHILFYVRCNNDGEPIGSERRADAEWLDDGLDFMRCCDKCCPVE